MKDYLIKLDQYYTQFADVMQKKFMQIRFGIKTCSVEYDIELALMRKELVDWQRNNDCDLTGSITVDAGGRQNINLPRSTSSIIATLNPGSAEYTSLIWTQVSGPNTGIIITPTLLSTQIAGLVEGSYTFKVSVITTEGIVSDETTVSILYLNPRVDAGTDLSIYSNNNTGTLTGTQTPGSYPIASSVWTKVSGPAIGTISSNGVYSNLINGNYVFRKTVTDINNRSSSDDMILSVLPASVVVNYGWSSINPYTDLLAGLAFDFQKSQTISAEDDLILDFHDMPKFNYPVIEVPASHEIKNYYVDSGSEFNRDFIPGDHFRETFVVSGKRYYTTYGTESFSSGINDRVTFSKPI